MSFFGKLKRRQSEQAEARRAQAMMEAVARGATPEEAQRAGDRAARRRANTNAAIMGSINS
ncbi:hypothetical protein [Streptomyces sp. NBC_01497]|uniref:hypothetical protein n=1 Tax=Streptomyces sp. NBC_01497 TaxID=2903885 RepID=UPI002E35479E|nr:hypothetical protein [Streptomyces sp. NBC_01497]